MNATSHNWERAFDAKPLSRKAAKLILRVSLIISLIFYITYFKLGTLYLQDCGSVDDSFGLFALPFEALIYTLALFLFIWMIGYVIYFLQSGFSKLDLFFILISFLFCFICWHISSFSYNAIKAINLNYEIAYMRDANQLQQAFVAVEKNPSTQYARYTLATIVLNDNTGTQTLEKIANNAKLHYRLDCSIHNLLVPMMDECISIVRVVARHRNASPAILTKLSTDYSLASDIAANPKTPAKVLESLIIQAEGNPNDIRILQCLVKNPNIPTPILKRLSNHHDEIVRGEALKQLHYREFRAKK